MKIFHLYDTCHECDDVYCSNVDAVARNIAKLNSEFSDLGFHWERGGYYSYFNDEEKLATLRSIEDITATFLRDYFDTSRDLALEFSMVDKSTEGPRFAWIIKLVDVEE